MHQLTRDLISYLQQYFLLLFIVVIWYRVHLLIRIDSDGAVCTATIFR